MSSNSSQHPNSDIVKATEILHQGGVVGMPTETVYGLAARIDLPSGIEKIFTTKERPFFDPLIVHVSSVEQAQTVVSDWGPIASVLATHFWPGPLTMVLPRAASLNSMITSGLDSVGVRMPSHPLALALLDAVGVPLAAPSANKFGKTSPTSAAHVRQEFAKENVFVLDGGECQVGIESTVLLIKDSQISILRKGHVLRSQIEQVLQDAGIEFQYVEAVSKKESPGHMKHHYMPAIPLVLVKSGVSRDLKMSPLEIAKKAESLLGQMPDVIEDVRIQKPQGTIQKARELVLSADPVLASRELYASLRRSAESGADLLYFYVKPEHQGERWESLFDRLNKAASLIF